MATGMSGGGPGDVGKTPTKLIRKKRIVRCFVCGKDVSASRKYYSVNSKKRSNNPQKEHSVGCVLQVLQKLDVIDKPSLSHVCYLCCRNAETIVATESVVKRASSSIDYREQFHLTQATWEENAEDDSHDQRIKRMISSPHGRRPRKKTSLSYTEEIHSETVDSSASVTARSKLFDSGHKYTDTGLNDQVDLLDANLTLSDDVTDHHDHTEDGLESSTEQSTRVEVIVHYKQSRPRRKVLHRPWAAVGKALCFGNEAAAVKHLLEIPEYQQQASHHVADIIKRESVNICKRPKPSNLTEENPSLFRDNSPKALNNWSYDEQKTELEKKAPILLTMLEAAAINRPNLQKNKQKTEDTLLPGLMSAAGILFFCRSQEMRAHATLTGLQLKRGGADKKTIERLHARKMSTAYQTVKNKQTEYGKNFDKKVFEWGESMERDKNRKEEFQKTLADLYEVKKEARGFMATAIAAKAIKHIESILDNLHEHSHPGFRIVGDNVDHKVKPRHMLTTRASKDYHHFHMFAVKNRVSAMNLPNDTAIAAGDKLDIFDLLPSVKDNQMLRHTWCVLTGRIIANYMSEMKWIKQHLPPLAHQHMKEAKSKSEIVHLGVIPHNENTKEGIHKIMKHIHTYVPGHSTDSPIPIISGGDLLTCEREAKSLEDKRDSTTANERLEGLIPTTEDFHTLANFYQVIWKTLYNSMSAGDVGTLMYCRNNLGAKNLTSDPMKDVNAARDFLDKWTEVLVLTAALDFFGMESVTSEPSQNGYDFTENHNRDVYVMDMLGKFVDSYAVPSDDEFITTQNNDLRCPFCEKTFKQVGTLQKHFQNVHSRLNAQQVIDEDVGGEEGCTTDSTYNYARNALSLCLLAHDFTDARQTGDGERIVRLHKFLMLHFKACNKYKYAKHTLRHVAMARSLLPPRQAYELTWNRFINGRGRADTNVEMDRWIEFLNRVYKGNVRGFRGKITEDGIKRVSRSAQQIEEALIQIDEQSQVKSRAGKHTPVSHEHDVINLVGLLQAEHVFVETPGRYLHCFPAFPRTLLGRINIDRLHQWMEDEVETLTSQHCFRRLQP